MNERIRARELNVIDDKGQPIGVLPTHEAIALARERGLDLVEVQPNAVPPVARILDYGQWQYQQSRSNTKTKKVELKTVQISFKIAAHDLDVRKNQALKFLDRGDKVQATMRLRGREKSQVPLAKELMATFVQSLGDNIVIDKPIAYLGAQISIIVRKK